MKGSAHPSLGTNVGPEMKAISKDLRTIPRLLAVFLLHLLQGLLLLLLLLGTNSL